MQSWRSVLIAGLVLIVLFQARDCTSAHNLQHLLRHPHYAQGHKHGQDHHSQEVTPHRKPSSTSFSKPIPSVRSMGGVPRDQATEPWTHVASVPKEYYRTNGFRPATFPKNQLVIDSKLAKELEEVREANEHFLRIRMGATCRFPKPQVVCVRDFYPEKELLPRCTILHRCSESAGCCEDETLSCGPKAMQEVVLHFYVSKSSFSTALVVDDDRASSDVEKLLFVNHTECECQHVAQVSTTVPTYTTTTPQPQPPVSAYKCRSCPVPFCARVLEDGRCTCDCFDRHKPCLRVKKGREALSEVERRCVDARRCQTPECEYGAYEPEKGRCPRRPDHEGAPRRHQLNLKNPHHRWNYIERD